jgi:glycosyltransferase involved in cell wall biosynthesis
MSDPKVSFVIPCYKLAHLLPECIRSILSQTFQDFEILIMDDCSPDITPEVARSFNDLRVKHVRNDPNLGHLRNYNRGISLSKGKYIWLISADDYLRKPYVLEKYVRIMEANPRLGYAFCPGFGVLNGHETQLVGVCPMRKQEDSILAGHTLLRRLLLWNFVLAASGLVRRDCYEQNGAFPLDMPWVGDWYLWCLFALHHDVAYFSEPMVCYRTHELSMTKKLFREDVAGCCEEELRVLWTIKRKADEAGFRRISKYCLGAVAEIYAKSVATRRYGMTEPVFTVEQFERSISERTKDEFERKRIRSRAYAEIANQYYWQGDIAKAKVFYKAAVGLDFRMGRVHLKRFLLALGKSGEALRKTIFSFRQTPNQS